MIKKPVEVSNTLVHLSDTPVGSSGNTLKWVIGAGAGAAGLGVAGATGSGASAGDIFSKVKRSISRIIRKS